VSCLNLKNLSLFIFLFIISITSYSQPTLRLDYAVTGDDSITVTNFDETPVFVDVDGQRFFQVTVVLDDAVDLIGVNFDLVFDNTVLNVVDIFENRGDRNFDGRANIADVLALGERLGLPYDQLGYSYFDLDNQGTVIEVGDINVLQNLLQNPLPNLNLYWTSNPDTNLDTIRESVEIFETPEQCNADGVLDDFVVTLLPRNHPPQDDFGFNGDARIVDIVFQVIDPAATSTVISFQDAMVITEQTEITTTEIIGAVTPDTPDVTIPLNQ
jgi:hypothetical protein